MGGLAKAAGNVVHNAVKNPLSTIGDVAAVATGNPLFAVAGNTGNGLAKGQSLGKSVGSGAVAGAESLAGGELAGAAGSAFPETFGAINDALGTGFSTGGNSLSDALGFSSGAGTSLDSVVNSIGNVGGSVGSAIGDIGNGISSGFDSLTNGVEGLFSSGAGATGSDAITSADLAAPSASPYDPTQYAQAAVQGATGAAPTAATAGIDQSAGNFGKTLGSLDPTVATGLNPAGVASSVSGGAPAAAAAPATSSFDKFLDNPSLSTAGNALKNNASALIPAGALAYSAAKGQQLPKGYNELKSSADQLAGQGSTLQSYLQNGTLPAGAAGAIQQAADSQKAAIRSQYASRGMSGSSAEQQDLARIDQQVQTQGFQIATQLLQTGVNENQLAAGIYQNLMNTQIQQDAQLGSALSNFGVALGGGSPTQTFHLTAG